MSVSATPAQPSVTLNLFQGPSLGLRRTRVKCAGLAVAPFTPASESAAQWMLKQVQHDDVCGGGA
jgi:hypothetical protein